MMTKYSKSYRIFALGGTLLLTACSATPVKQGVVDGALGRCGDKPNCVSSLDRRDDYFITPLRYTKQKAQGLSILQNHLQRQDNVDIHEMSDNYIWAVYTTPLMRFDDDVEFHFSAPGIIQVRSASRVGYSDLGANRKRIEKLRQDLQSKLTGE